MNNSVRQTSISILIFSVFLFSCKKAEIPIVETSEITEIKGTSALSGGIVIDEGSGKIIDKGVCYGTGVTPTIANIKTSDGAGPDTFISNISGLNGGTTYYVRAYATNSAGTGYGLILSFATLGKVPYALTQQATNVTTATATLNAEINANDLSTIVSFEYGTTAAYGQTIIASQSPVTDNSNTSVSADISNLNGGAIYHYRVKTVNSLGTSYGEDMSFATSHRILKVPADFPTIAQAVGAAGAGETIIISPGKYYENNITINKAVTISSEWKLTEDVSKIEETIIDSQDKILFTITSDGVEISGLRIINGNHTLNIEANVSVMYNHFVRNLDAMSFESPGGGYAGYNIVENDRDDGLDSDIIYNANKHGSDLIIENNTIINSNDDGIEIRLYSYVNQNINYILRGNTIKGSKNAGIQIISYDVYTGKKFQIHHNIITGCKTGLGCMDGSNTNEDLSGALYMDEQILFFNNTLAGNQMGATGGNYVIAVNNIVKGNSLGGFKRFGGQSAVINNLFYGNGVADFIEINESVPKSGNIFSVDPLLDNTTFAPAAISSCIDAGISKYDIDLNNSLVVPAKYISGSAPDIGAVELNGKHIY